MKKLSETRYMQFVAAFGAAATGPAAVAHVNWASPSLPILQSNDSPLGRPLGDEEASWMVSVLFLLALPGGFLGAFLAEWLGRKKALLVGGLLILAAWIVVMVGKSLAVLYVARCLAGLAMGLTSTVAPIYVGEIAEDDIRGMLGISFGLMTPLSALIVLSVGPYVSYLVLAIICAVMPCIFLAWFVWMPETPYYWIKKGNIEESRKSLIRLSASTSDKEFIDEKLEKIKDLIERNLKTKKGIGHFLRQREFLKPLGLIIGIQVVCQLSGSVAIESYMQTIISASQSSISAEQSSIIFGAVKIPAALIAALLCDRLGRKALLAISLFGCGVALIGEGAYFYVQDFVNGNVDSITWLPTAGLTLYQIMNPIGIGAIPQVLISEIFPSEAKEVAVSTIQLFSGSLSFVVSKTFSSLSNAWGIFTMFWIFAGICLAGIIYLYALLPETKGKSFAEIQEKLHRKKSRSPLTKRSKNAA